VPRPPGRAGQAAPRRPRRRLQFHPRDSPLYLYFGSGINDRGEIAGYAFLKSNPNEQPGFLAIPAPAAQIAGDSAQKIILPENIRASLQRRLRLGRPTTQQ
jgi:hypothetical protein